jgi:hypothetical protein
MSIAIDPRILLALPKFRTTPTTQPERTEPRPSTPKTAPFSRVGAYNPSTTRKANISQFCENGPLISHLTKAIYKKVKICARIALNGSAVVSCVGSSMDSWGDTFLKSVFR